MILDNVKAILSPRGGAYLILDLLERGAYSQNQVTRIYLVAFHFLYPIFWGITISRLITLQFNGLIIVLP